MAIGLLFIVNYVPFLCSLWAIYCDAFDGHESIQIISETIQNKCMSPCLFFHVLKRLQYEYCCLLLSVAVCVHIKENY